MELAKVYAMSFASIYPLYVKKAEKKGRTKAEVDEILFRLAALCPVSQQRTSSTSAFVRPFLSAFLMYSG